MKAAIIDRGGAPDILRVVDLPDPIPGDTDLLVRVEAISIEGGDLTARREGQTLSPAVIGYAAAGEVVEMGRLVEGFAIGQKVATFAFAGSHASLRVAPAATSFVVPDGLDIRTAAAIPCGPGTAALALELGRVHTGDIVLVTGASGGVGAAAVQLAARRGARVIGTGRDGEVLQRLRDYGLSDAVVTTADKPAGEQVRALTNGAGANLLIDTVGGMALTDGLSALADGGRAVMVGVIGGFNTAIDAGILFAHRLTVIGCFLGPVMGERATRALIVDLLERAATGSFSVRIDAVFPLTEIAAAHRRAEEKRRFGRVIVTIDK